MNNQNVLKKAVKIAANVLLYAFVAICLLGVILTITAKKDDDGTATIFGMQMRFVKSPSMEKCELTDLSEFEIKDIPMRSMVFVEVVPEDEAEAERWYANLKVGDVLTFRYVYVKQETITHRITNIEKKENGGYLITLEGDNKNSEDGVLSQLIDTSNADINPNHVIGKVVGQNYPLGLFVYVLESPIGMIGIIIIPALIIIVLEIIKIVNLLTADKKRAEQEKREQEQNELEELRRRLAELETVKSDAEEKVDVDSYDGNAD